MDQLGSTLNKEISMPELPEVETVRRLASAVSQK